MWSNKEIADLVQLNILIGHRKSRPKGILILFLAALKIIFDPYIGVKKKGEV